MALINKSQIQANVPLTVNIPATTIDPHIYDAELFDLNPLFERNEDVLDTLRGVVPFLLTSQYRVWDAVTSFNLGDYILYREFVFKLLANTSLNSPPLFVFDKNTYGNTQPAPDPADTQWQYEKERTAYAVYIVPFLSCCAVQRYLPFAGRNLDQSGITTPLADTFTPTDAQGRSEVQGSIRAKKGLLESRLRRYLVRSKLITTFNDYYHSCNDWRQDYYWAYGYQYANVAEVRDNNDFGIFAI